VPNIKHLLTINAPVDRVYQAAATQDGVAGWWTEETTIDDQVGGFAEFRFGDRYYNKMEITRLEPGRLVEWKCLEGDPEWIGTTLVFDLESADGATRLRFGHNDWRDETDFFANCNFHWGFYMQSLKEFCETGEGTPYQDR
jgi:uncharacterized protein YndB with AHSA1/START domain